MFSCIRSAGFRSGVVVGVLAGVLLAFGPALTARADGLTRDAQDVHEWLGKMARHFDARPELKETKGSGWKPYNRYKWFIEQRMLDGELPPVGARWQAWERKREIERTSGVTPRNTWFTLGPANFGGRMLSIDFDPNNALVIYAGGADGGLWKSTDGGTSWTPMTDELPSLAVGGVAVSKTNSNIVVIGTGEGTFNVDRVSGVGILRSTDAGATWNTTSLSMSQGSGHGFHVVTAGPNGTFVAGATDGLWRSDDDGVTWTQVKVGGDYYDVQWKPGSPNTVFAAKGDDGSGNSVKISTDDGLTWTKAGTGQPFSFLVGKTKIAMSAANPNVIYALYAEQLFGGNGGTVGVYRSTDGGSTWTAQNTVTNIAGGQGWYNLALVADPDDATRIIAGGVNLFRSTNSGVSFTTAGANVHVDHHALAYEPGSTTNLWVANDGGMWRSTADGSSWTSQNSGLVTYQFYDICVNNNTNTSYYVMGGTQDNGTDKWSGTTTWANGLGGDGMVCNINPVNGTTVYAERQFGNHNKNTNSGQGNWQSINGGLAGGNNQWVVPVAEDQTVGNHLYTNHSSTGLYRTTDGGNQWVNVDGSSANWIDISPVDGNVIWAISGNTIRLSTDDGGTWNNTASLGFSAGGGTKIAAHPTDVNTAVATFSSYGSVAHVAVTTDQGASWSDVSGNLPQIPVNAIAIDPSNPSDWYIGTDVGVWFSSDGGANWLPFETGLPNAVVVDLEIADAQRKLVAGTHGRGAWEVDIPPTSTDAEVTVAPLARNLMLDRPWPNPVRDRTLLRYAAKHDGPVSLRIYDVRGRLVSNLADLPKGDGVIRTTPWFPDDAPSGVYFAVLRAGGVQKSQKIVVSR